MDMRRRVLIIWVPPAQRPPLPAFNRQNLAAFVIAAGRANGVTCNRAAALRTLAKLRPMPAVRRFACAQSHLGRFAFGDSHVSGLEKQSVWKTQTRSHFFNFNLSCVLQSDLRFVSAAAALFAAALLSTG